MRLRVLREPTDMLKRLFGLMAARAFTICAREFVVSSLWGLRRMAEPTDMLAPEPPFFL